MKDAIKFFLLFIIILAVQPSFAQWSINDDYKITFKGKGAEGNFKGLEGTINFNPDDLANSLFQVSINPSTIDTGNDLKNKHARGDKWFNIETYQTISFSSKNVTNTTEGYELTGEIELHGIIKEITIPFSFKESNNQGLFKGEFTLNREDFGIMGPLFSFMVGEDFIVNLEVPVTKH